MEHYFPAESDEVWHHYTTYFSHPLFLLLCADVTADVGPRDVLRPPHWLTALFTPARLPSACWVLQHLWDERSQLGLNNNTDTDTKTLKWKAAVSLSHTHISKHALEQAAGGAYWSGACCRGGHSLQIETGFLKRSTMWSRLLTDQSMAVAPGWCVRQTPWEHQGRSTTVQQSTRPNKGSNTLRTGINKDKLLNVVKKRKSMSNKNIRFTLVTHDVCYFMSVYREVIMSLLWTDLSVAFTMK